MRVQYRIALDLLVGRQAYDSAGAVEALLLQVQADRLYVPPFGKGG